MVDMYFSGYAPRSRWDNFIYEIMPHRLMTLHEDYRKPTKNWIIGARDCLGERLKEKKVIFDSGAFTAWSKSKGEVQLNVYDLLNTYEKFGTAAEKLFGAVYYISLDVIPGKPGVTATKDEIEAAIEKSDINHEILRQRFGNTVLPVFHQSEDEDRLFHICHDLNPEYVCLSPRNDVATRYRLEWSLRCHDAMAAAGLGHVKTHCLGTTSGDMVLTVPWTSVDSSTWIQSSINGQILLPTDRNMKTILVSEHSPSRRHWGKHATTAGAQVDAAIDAQLDALRQSCDNFDLHHEGSKLSNSVTFEGLMSDHMLRMAWNILVISDVASKEYRPTNIPGTLFAL